MSECGDSVQATVTETVYCSREVEIILMLTVKQESNI